MTVLKREKQQMKKKLEIDVQLKFHKVWQDIYRAVLVDVFLEM